MIFTSVIDPVAFELGALQIRWYGLLFSGGFVLGYFIMQYWFRRRRYPTTDLDRLLVYVFLGTVIGARLGHCLIYEPDYFLSSPLEILKVWKGGLASHGGTLGVIVSMMIFNRHHRYRLLELMDMLCIPVLLVCVLIRLGNFCNAEIVGIPTSGHWGVIFARLGENFPRHPAQLYEALCYLILFVSLGWLYLKHGFSLPCGLTLGLSITLIFMSRLIVEFVKVEQADYTTGTVLTVGQLLSVPFVLGGLAVCLWAWRHGRAPAPLKDRA